MSAPPASTEFGANRPSETPLSSCTVLHAVASTESKIVEEESLPQRKRENKPIAARDALGFHLARLVDWSKWLDDADAAKVVHVLESSDSDPKKWVKWLDEAASKNIVLAARRVIAEVWADCLFPGGINLNTTASIRQACEAMDGDEVLSASEPGPCIQPYVHDIYYTLEEDVDIATELQRKCLFARRPPDTVAVRRCMRKIIEVLQAYSPHCDPFLEEVTPLMAPDYHLHIKEPMDFGTMMKSVVVGKYDNKWSEFERHMMLIYENCRVYNCTEGNEYAAKANTMEAKTKLLLSALRQNEQWAHFLSSQSPTTTITNPSTENGGHTHSMDVDDASTPVPNSEHTRRKRTAEDIDHVYDNTGTETSSMDVPREVKRSRVSESRASHASAAADDVTERDGDSGSALPDHRCNTSDADSSSAHTAANRASGAREKGAALLRANSDVDGRAAAYRDGTRAQRMVTLANRARDAVVRRGLPGFERRTRENMTRAIQHERRTLTVLGGQAAYFPELQPPMHNMPPFNVLAKAPQSAGLRQQSADSRSFASAVQSTLLPDSPVLGNIHLMRSIRDVKNFVGGGELPEVRAWSGAGAYRARKKPPLLRTTDTPRKPSSPALHHAVGRRLSSGVAGDVTRRSVAVLAMHAGFESAEVLAVNALTDRTVAFMNKLCRHIRMVQEDVPTEHTLHDCAAIAIRRAMDDGLAALTTYWRDEVQGFRHQLRSIETHIHAKFTTLMEMEQMAGVGVPDDVALATGNFGTGVGDVGLDLLGIVDMELSPVGYIPDTLLSKITQPASHAQGPGTYRMFSHDDPVPVAAPPAATAAPALPSVPASTTSSGLPPLPVVSLSTVASDTATPAAKLGAMGTASTPTEASSSSTSASGGTREAAELARRRKYPIPPAWRALTTNEQIGMLHAPLTTHFKKRNASRRSRTDDT